MKTKFIFKSKDIQIKQESLHIIKAFPSSAKAVYDFLIKFGISPGRLNFIGLGATQPVELDPTMSDKNRRIEFRIIDKNKEF